MIRFAWFGVVGGRQRWSGSLFHEVLSRFSAGRIPFGLCRSMQKILSASLRDPKWIAIKTCYEAKDFCASLPGARWDSKLLAWLVRYTAATCYRIVFDAPHALHVEVDETIRGTGCKFFESIRPLPENVGQPEIRRLDAWRHQAHAFAFAMQREATLLNCGLGTGKSAVAVNIIQNSNCRLVLICCPVSVRAVWRREFFKHCIIPHEVLILEKGSTKDKQIKAQQFLETRSGLRVVVVNYDTAKLEPFASWSVSVDWDCVIGDESQRFKSPTSNTSKYMAKLNTKRRRLALTGTPMQNGPLDIFGQFRFLDPGVLGDSYHRFRSHFAVSGPFGADHIVGYKNQEELGQRMALLTFTVGREVLDLPPVTHNVRTCELCPESKRLYREMEEDLIAFLDDGGEVTAPNGLVKLLRLMQITSGHIKSSEDEITRSLGTEKADVLDEILDELPHGEPVVVFCNFRYDLDAVQRVVEKRGLRYGELSGRRKDLTEHAQMPDTVDVLAVQFQAGGVGVDLVRAAYCVFLSSTHNGGNFEQAQARVSRPGQTRPVIYFHILCVESVDVTVYRALRDKKDVVQEVLTALRGEEGVFDDGDSLGLGTVVDVAGRRQQASRKR